MVMGVGGGPAMADGDPCAVLAGVAVFQSS